MKQGPTRCLLLGGVAAVMAWSLPLQAQTALYVTPAPPWGSCTSLSSPCSLETAQSLVRTLVGSMTADIHVYLRGGIYQRTQTFTLDGALDSGRNTHYVSYEAYGTETPVLSGGTQITGWAPYQNGIWRAAVPATLKTRDLFVNAIRAERTRGLYDDQNNSQFHWAIEGSGNGYIPPPGAMPFVNGIPMYQLHNIGDIEIVNYANFKGYRCGVSYITPDVVGMDQPCFCLGRNAHAEVPIGLPRWFENIFELLGVPGQWYLDSTAAPDGNHYLYYTPRQGEILSDPSSTQVIVPVLQALVVANGTAATPIDHIILKGLVFANTAWLAPSDLRGYPSIGFGRYWTHYTACNGGPDAVVFQPAAISFSYAHSVQIERCTFARLGQTALELRGGSKNNLVEGNTFRDVDGGGLRLGDNLPPGQTNDADVAEDNIVQNNYVTDIGREYFDTMAIEVLHARGTIVAHNEIHNVPYSAIGVGMTNASDEAYDNHISGNRAHNALQRLKDGALAYVIEQQPNSTIEGNVLHDVITHIDPGPPPTPFGPIYLDYGTKLTSIHDNVSFSAESWLFVNMCPNLGSGPPQNNDVTNTFSDNPNDHCHCLPCDGNTIDAPTLFTPGQWPAAASTILSSAGVSPSFGDLYPKIFRIEAEDFIGVKGVGYWDTDGNVTHLYRSDEDVDIFQSFGVDVSNSTSTIIGFSNDHAIGNIRPTEWLKYYVDVPRTSVIGSGNAPYSFVLWMRSGTSTNTVQVQVDAGTPHTFVLPITAGTAITKVAVPGTFTLAPGTHVVTISFSGPTFDSHLALDAFTYSRP